MNDAPDAQRPSRPSATVSDLPAWLGEESLLDALDLDPDASLSELAEQLRELSTSAEPETRERARRTFERLAERPEAHFAELLKAVPQLDGQSTARRRPPARPASPPAWTVGALLPPPPLDACLGPPTDGERALLSPPRHLGHLRSEGT